MKTPTGKALVNNLFCGWVPVDQMLFKLCYFLSRLLCFWICEFWVQTLKSSGHSNFCGPLSELVSHQVLSYPRAWWRRPLAGCAPSDQIGTPSTAYHLYACDLAWVVEAEAPGARILLGGTASVATGLGCSQCISTGLRINWWINWWIWHKPPEHSEAVPLMGSDHCITPSSVYLIYQSNLH